MPQCRKCGKKGLFLKIVADTGLCPSCNEIFSQEGRILTEKITEVKNAAAVGKDPKEVAGSCQLVVDYGNDLL